MSEKEEKILELFYNYPNKHFGVRELAKKTKLATRTIQIFLKNNFSIIKRVKKKGKYAYYKTDFKSKLLRYKKTSYMLEKIIKSGLIEYLERKTKAKAIILFGSIAKGTYRHDSDIDIFVQSEKIPLNIGKFDKILGKEINILFEHDIDTLTPGLLNNLSWGIGLSGRFDVANYDRTKYFSKLPEEEILIQRDKNSR